MALFTNAYTTAWDQFRAYVDRNAHEPDQREYDRLSRAVDAAAVLVPWWQRL
jgi:hypothetical protein